MWLAYTLLKEGETTENPVIEKALAFSKSSPAGKSIEWYVIRLLLAVQTNNATLRDAMIEQLRSLQKPDGGWGWMTADESDALGTGMAVYALLRAGTERTDTTIQRAQQFLVSTQRKDGSWPVKGTKAKKKGSIQETAVYWGTCWAVIGLVESLPQ